LIITQTPLRISFFGGGTDFREYFLQEGGCVLSSAIDRYIFVIIKQRFDNKIRVGYTKTEMVDTVDDLEHELVRECLRKTGISKRVEIATMGDIPSSGSGMGSSSTVTVGLLNAMYHYLGQPKDSDTLARQACEIELDVLKKPIGMQDQYIAAYGGQRFISFGRDAAVRVSSLQWEEGQRRQFGQHLLLFFTNVTRKAETILSEQVNNISSKIEILGEMKKLAHKAIECLISKSYDDFGLLLHEAWQLKKQLASRITNGSLDEIYASARRAGALGGKVTGAGGGGFLLLYCRPEHHNEVRYALRNLPELSFNLEPFGTKVIFNYSR
jgi:D-glycero-alpha-D-manno-heptose-7-phosphate kinase